MKLSLCATLLAATMSLTHVSAEDQRVPSSQPPGGLEPAEVPQFVMIGFDDNPEVEPMQWIVDYAENLTNPAGSDQILTFDGEPVRFAFYSNTTYIDNSRELAELHYAACMAGHEIGNHTHSHHHGGAFTPDEWFDEMARCRSGLLKAGIITEQQQGFRAPYLEYNNHTFTAARKMGLTYDTSIEEGYQLEQDGTNFLWPYTLDHGSPGNAYYHPPGSPRHITSHPGLWEIPLHVFMVPPDERAMAYGIEPGLAQRIHDSIAENQGWEWSQQARKITGLDWNVFEGASRSADEFLAILKHTLELRLAGNRAPLMIGGHTALFPADEPDRRKAMEAFIDFALSHPEVRFVTPVDLIRWLRDPVALRR